MKVRYMLIYNQRYILHSVCVHSAHVGRYWIQGLFIYLNARKTVWIGYSFSMDDFYHLHGLRRRALALDRVLGH